MSRFFINETHIEKDKINVSGPDANHIKNVLRLRSGDRITLCNGKGMEYTAVITGFEPGLVGTAIISSCISGTEPDIYVTVFQGLPKSDKMELIIQKGVELGVNKIVPVICERTITKINNNKDSESKVARWRKISREAACQCDRSIIPEVECPVLFNNALELAKMADFTVIPYEMEERLHLKDYFRIRSVETPNRTVSIIIGPEGGFSADEIKRAVMQGIQPVTLGPRILRTETAGIAVLAAIMYDTGNF